MHLFRQIYNLCSSELKHRFWCLFVGMLVLAVVETVTVGIIAFYAAAISDPKSTYQAFVAYQSGPLNISELFPFLSIKTMIAGFSFLLIFAVIFKNIYSGIMTLQIAKFSSLAESYFGCQLLEHFLNRDYRWHLDQNSADLIQYVNWRHFLGRNFLSSSLKIMTEISMLVVLLFGLLLVQPLVSLLFIFFQGTAGFFVYRFLRQGLDHSAKGCREAEIELNRNITRSLHAIKDVQISGSQNYFVAGFRAWAMRYSQLFGKQQFWRESPLLTLETLGFIMIAAAILFMLFGLGYSPLETTGATALLAVTAWRTLPAFNRVVSSLAGIRTAKPYVDQLIDELTCQSDQLHPQDNVDSVPPIEFSKSVEFKDVSFSYDDQRLILSAVNLQIEKGHSIGIMGPSGCGKSTLIDLLTGLLIPQQGEILIDGEPLTQKNRAAWQNCIGYVPQFPYIFDGTLAENVAFGLPPESIDKSRVDEVCQMAAIDFLEQLPQGIDSIIGERGVKLSGGQRQRVAIARALYRKPQLLIFDEATSALDEDKDFEIRLLISQLKGKQTLVIVSHRPSTIADCDDILRL